MVVLPVSTVPGDVVKDDAKRIDSVRVVFPESMKRKVSTIHDLRDWKYLYGQVRRCCERLPGHGKLGSIASLRVAQGVCQDKVRPPGHCNGEA